MERVFLKPGAVTRWPLYLRQAKAVLRAGDEGFDERKFGFAGLVEALRFGQREGLFRLDRDRQGVLRVYPGQLLQRAEGGGAMAGADAAPSIANRHGRGPRAGRADGRADGRRRADRGHVGLRRRAAQAEAPAPVAKATKRRGGAAKKPAAAKKAAPQGPRGEGSGGEEARRQEGRRLVGDSVSFSMCSRRTIGRSSGRCSGGRLGPARAGVAVDDGGELVLHRHGRGHRHRHHLPALFVLVAHHELRRPSGTCSVAFGSVPMFSPLIESSVPSGASTVTGVFGTTDTDVVAPGRTRTSTEPR